MPQTRLQCGIDKSPPFSVTAARTQAEPQRVLMGTTSLVGLLLDQAAAPPTQDSEKLRVPSCQSLIGLDPEWLKGGVMIYAPLLFQEEGSCP